jgi:hypothetical protein
MQIDISEAGDTLNTTADHIVFNQDPPQQLPQKKIEERPGSAPKVSKNAICFNIDFDLIKTSEEEIKKNLSCNLVSQHLEIPGFSRLFPSRMKGYASGTHYMFHEESQRELFSVAQKLYEIEHAIRKEKRLSKNFQERYIQFILPTYEELTKYKEITEDEYLREIHDDRKKPKHVLSSQGIGMTYRMWN